VSVRLEDNLTLLTLSPGLTLCTWSYIYNSPTWKTLNCNVRHLVLLEAGRDDCCSVSMARLRHTGWGRIVLARINYYLSLTNFRDRPSVTMARMYNRGRDEKFRWRKSRFGSRFHENGALCPLGLLPRGPPD